MRNQLSYSITAILIIQILLTFGSTFSVAASDGGRASQATNSISGSVWMDENRNGIWELGEKPRPNTMVFLQYEGEDLIQALTTNDEGVFVFNQLHRGAYQIWCMDGEGVASQAVIEIDEVVALASITLAVEPDHAFFLPLVMR